MTLLADYLTHVRLIKASKLASDERSYYPALSALFDAVGATLSPRVLAIHDVRDGGAGHPDFLLQVETTHDTRASIEAKPAFDDVNAIARSEQVRRYLRQYGLCLVTNLRHFVLVRHGRNGQAVEIMRYELTATEADFWNASAPSLAKRHDEGLRDFLVSVLTWDAPIARPKELAEALARYAREALRRLSLQPAENLVPLRTALSKALGLHFTDEQGEHFFRSSLVQTLFYGLFSAWVVWNRGNAGADEFRWRDAGDYLRLPVMRELFEHLAMSSTLEMLDIRKPVEWAEATLRRTAWEAFAAGFDQGDAVNYFYEPFLEAYDPTLREQLGVWYTPREIITYQVARVDRLLREELNIPAGLADEQVVVLDPATGTGGYLLEVLRVIDATLRERGAGAMRALELRKAATSRVFGFEILPAPFVVAHLQIATLLAERDAPLAERQRAGVYLTNSLTGWKVEEVKQLVLPEYPALKGEAEAAARVKHQAKILVILGNPPYRGQAGVAEDEEHDLLAPYYEGLTDRFGIQARGLNDLYIRFFRLAERQIAEATGRGIVSYISNYSWLSGLSHVIMREQILTGFDKVWVDNLHGDRIISERTPNGKSCETIFAERGRSTGIKVGTAISTLVRNNERSEQRAVYYRDVWGMPDDKESWGRAERKRHALLWSSSLPTPILNELYQPLKPNKGVRFLLKPGASGASYLSWPTLVQVFPQHYPGFKTSRDGDLIAIDQEPLRTRMQHYFDSQLSDTDVAQYAPALMTNTSGYSAKQTRQELLRTSKFQDEYLVRVAYRPLDERWLYWEPKTKLLDRNRSDFFEQVEAENLFLVANASSRRDGSHSYVADKFVCLDLMDRNALCFPMHVHTSLFGESTRVPNLSANYLAFSHRHWHFADHVAAEVMFFHALAIMRSPLYYRENKTHLMQDWPRIPIPTSRELLEASAALGRRVADLLRPDVPFNPPGELYKLGVPKRIDGGQLSEDDLRVTVRYSGKGKYDAPVAEGPGARPGRLWWNDVAYWENVPQDVWAFTIGGYPVVKKWLDYRHIEKLKRPLKLEEVRYVAEMVQRIAALLALGPELDAIYEAVKAQTLSLTPPPAVARP